MFHFLYLAVCGTAALQDLWEAGIIIFHRHTQLRGFFSVLETILFEVDKNNVDDKVLL